jgi:glutathione S-transferase
MANRVQVVGSYLSPYVRKVLVVLALKGVEYEIDPIIPFMGDDRFSAISPIRRIPVFMDGEVTLSDSTVICEYLEESYPDPPLLPAEPVQRARARWFEEYADTRMGEVLIWKLFNQFAINPFVWGTEADEAALQKTLENEIPQILGYLESQLPASGFLFDHASIADIAIASPFRNAAFARFEIDRGRWPLTAAFVARVLALEPFEKLERFENRLMRTPIAEHRQVLSELGAPLMKTSYGTDKPRRGLMRI